MQNHKGCPVHLDEKGWWSQLNVLSKECLSAELAQMLMSLISATQNSQMGPEATKRLIGLAKEHIAGGIWIGEKFYDVQVCVPDDPSKRSFFVLSRRWPDATVRRLDEI